MHTEIVTYDRKCTNYLLSMAMFECESDMHRMIAIEKTTEGIFQLLLDFVFFKRAMVLESNQSATSIDIANKCVIYNVSQCAVGELHVFVNENVRPTAWHHRQINNEISPSDRWQHRWKYYDCYSRTFRRRERSTNASI